MVFRDPLIDVGDGLGQVIELALAALKHQEQASEEQLGVNATPAIARMQLLVQSSRLGRCAQQPGANRGRTTNTVNECCEAVSVLSA